MADNNTIKTQIQTLPTNTTIQNSIAPLTNAVASTTATAFALNSGAVSLGGGGVVPLAIGNPGVFFGSGKKFKVAARGQCITGTSATLTLKLYLVPATAIATAGFSSNNVSLLSQTTFTNWSLVATTTARAINTATGDWDFQAELQLTQAGTTGSLMGTFKDTINGLFDAEAAVTIVTGLVGEADLNFVIVSTLSAGNAANINTMTEFSIYGPL
jgi:hypothetical protein